MGGALSCRLSVTQPQGHGRLLHLLSPPGPRPMALTVCNGNPESTESWRRVIAPVCYRCLDLLGPAGGSGLVLKATGGRWFGGHTVGRFASGHGVRGIGEGARENAPWRSEC